MIKSMITKSPLKKFATADEARLRVKKTAVKDLNSSFDSEEEDLNSTMISSDL